MITWIKTFLTGFDRTQAASERMSKAMEDIADDFENLRDSLRLRFRGDVSSAPETLIEHTNIKRKGAKA